MKFQVKMNTSGQVWFFECYASNVNEAKRVAKNQYPNARIVTATATFR